MTRQTEITISTERVGVHFGCRGIVRRVSDRRIIHRTDPPRPYGFDLAAMDDAVAWAIDHGYIHIDDDRRNFGRA